MSVCSLETVCISDRGSVRANNQDAVFCDGDLGLVVVADGMGGHRGGEVASMLAAERVGHELRELQQVDEADAMQSLMHLGQSVEHINLSLYEEASRHPALEGMGTTLVAGVFRCGYLYFSHVGDSRLYRWRHGQLTRLTHDHSLVQTLVDQGMFASVEAARAAGVGSNILTRALGTTEHVEADLGEAQLLAGDLYLFCTDGLTGMVSDNGIARILYEQGDDLQQASDTLLAEALAAGGNDNITLVLARERSRAN